jgi:hypothetical protein
MHEILHAVQISPTASCFKLYLLLRSLSGSKGTVLLLPLERLTCCLRNLLLALASFTFQQQAI